MNVKQSYFDFLAKQEAKQKVKAVIEKGLSEWKTAQAYRFEDDEDPWTGDYSGHVWMIPDKKIGDIATTDIQVLKAYTGDSVATYVSRCGLHYTIVAERISDDINDCLSSIRGEFIEQNANALFEEYDIKREDDWNEDDVFLTLDEAICLNDHGMDFEWMRIEFPEYSIDDDELPGKDYMFDILY